MHLPAADALAGQHAVVTGAGRGIGAAVAAELARQGAAITLMGRTEEPLRQRLAELERAFPGRPAQHVQVDVTDPHAVAAAFQAAGRLGPTSILVNNAGAATSGRLVQTDLDDLRRLLEVNVVGPFLCSKAALPAMLEAGWGRIVNVASTAGLRGYAYASAYTAAKHGVVGLTRSLALEVARQGITVNAVCPGFADTEMTVESIQRIVARTGRTAEQARAELAGRNPQQRLVQPEEVAQAVGWLCLPTSASITGQAIVVAGGEVM